MSDPFGKQELEFPQEVHFRIIAQGDPAVDQAVKAMAEQLQVARHLTVSNASTGGKYQSYALTILIESQEQMDEIDAGFRGVEGVKMVL